MPKASAERYCIREIFGVSATGSLKELHALAENMGIGNRITWLGSVAHGEIAGYYEACDLILYLNDHANINNQLLEALYLGVPVIAFDDGCNRVLYGDCPYAMFVERERLNRVAERRGTADRRGGTPPIRRRILKHGHSGYGKSSQG